LLITCENSKEVVNLNIIKNDIMDIFEKGNTLDYFGKKVTVLEEDGNYVLIEFENKTKICTNKNTFLN
jgi:tyrosine-protein phosphatase YwqE